jgi:hypothetical protein
MAEDRPQMIGIALARRLAGFRMGRIARNKM